MSVTSDRILAVRGDGIGDVLLAEPAMRALAGDGEVTLLCGASGRAAADVIPSVSRTIVHDLAGIASDVSAVDVRVTRRLIDTVRDLAPARAVIFTSSTQSALPTALLLRLAGVPFIAARSLDAAGPLLDIRLAHDPAVHEVERNLELVEALGVQSPFDRRIRVRVGSLPCAVPAGSVVVHPGAGAPSRTPPPAVWRDVIARLAAEGHPVVLTGGRDDLAAASLRMAPGVAVDLVGRTTLPELARVLSEAAVVCIGHAGPMHLAAALGTPIVSVFPATVPRERWRPWMVDHEILGDPAVPCAPCFRRRCPQPGQPCVPHDAATIADAVGRRLGSVRAPVVGAG